MMEYNVDRELVISPYNCYIRHEESSKNQIDTELKFQIKFSG